MFPKEDRAFVLSRKVVEAPIEMVLVATASISYSAKLRQLNKSTFENSFLYLSHPYCTTVRY